MSPKDFVDDYLNLYVQSDPMLDPSDPNHVEYLAGWNVYVSIDKYQERRGNNKHRVDVAMSQADKPLEKNVYASAKANGGSIRVGIKSWLPQSLAKCFWRCFAGKGSPDDIALTLRMALRYGTNQPLAPPMLQGFCNKYLGLDCSGFVSNYANAALGKHFEVTNTNVVALYSAIAAKRSSIDDIEPLDLLIWSDKGHVAIIDSIDQGRVSFDRMKSASPNLSALVCNVAESHGHRGVGCSSYTFLAFDKSTSLFTVKREESGQQFKVWVGSL